MAKDGGNNGNYQGKIVKSAVKQLNELGAYPYDDFVELEDCQNFEVNGHVQQLDEVLDPSQVSSEGGIGEMIDPIPSLILGRSLSPHLDTVDLDVSSNYSFHSAASEINLSDFSDSMPVNN